MSTISKSLAALALLAGPILVHSQVVQSVLQRGYDANVSGANLTETALTKSNVGPTTFGLRFNLTVDDKVFAQPLYVPGVVIPGLGAHNVVYVATMSDSIYAFDADIGGAPLWSVNLASLFSTIAVPWADFTFNGGVEGGNLGILSTPVIDPSTNIMYVVDCALESGTMAYRLHAIDITTGMEPYGAGVLITGTFGGNTFEASKLTQRVSLALSGNEVVFGFGSMETEFSGNYVGWVIAYDKLTLQQTGIFATVATGNGGGGVWQSGRPPAIDSSGYAYVFVGNAWGDGYDGVSNFSESVLKLDPAHALALVDWFTPGNWNFLDKNDKDLTSSGPLLIPGTALLAGGGKTGDLYVLNTANLGKFVANDSQVVQKENITAGGEIHGGLVYWNRSAAAGGPLMYNWGAGDMLKTYPFSGGAFAISPSAVGASSAFMPGGMLALSANADQAGSGVLWATTRTQTTNTGVLHAFDAENVSDELWNSTLNAARDAYGIFAKFVPPLIANGRVYVATFSDHVAVYGLGATPTFTVLPSSLAFGDVQTNTPSAVQPVAVTNTGTVLLPISSVKLLNNALGGFYKTTTCGTSLAVGGNCTINIKFKPKATGAQTATLAVSGGGAGTQSVSLSGTGVVPPAYTALPAMLAFGNVKTGTASAAQMVTVTNPGTSALPITNIIFLGNSLGEFLKTTTCGASLAAGTSCTISVKFKPTTTGAQTATLEANAGGGAGTQSVSLSGTGAL